MARKISLKMNYRAERLKLGLSQAEFWGRICTTQSAGSRYETGASSVPRPIKMLAFLVYTSRINIDGRNYQ